MVELEVYNTNAQDDAKNSICELHLYISTLRLMLKLGRCDIIITHAGRQQELVWYPKNHGPDQDPKNNTA